MDEEQLNEQSNMLKRIKKLFKHVKTNPIDTDVFKNKYDLDMTNRTLGDFKIIRQIGAGGMAKVYEAEQISLKRKVALKVLPPHLVYSEKTVLKFQREAEAAGRQNHPGIAAVYGVGEHDNMYYIAQELVEGGYTLAHKLQELRNMEKPQKGYNQWAARIIADVAGALTHAHDSGVIHRDVKPSNILLTKDNQVKIADFGLARVDDALVLSRTGEFTGTPYYMSPEQALSRRMGIDHRTDIFSLGVTLFETITLERPFSGETSFEVIKKIVLHEPRIPAKIRSNVHRDLEIIALKAMEKDPDHRYQKMSDFFDDLNRFLNGEVILAKPVGMMGKLAKRIKRNPIVSSASAAILLSLLFLLVIMPWIIANNARKESNKTAAINDFLEDMIVSADPFRSGDKDMKVADVLRHGAKALETSFPDQPEIEASLRFTMARTFVSLGLPKEALVHGQDSLKIRKQLLGEEDEDTLCSMSLLATIYQKIGDSEQSLKLHQRTYDLRKGALGPDNPHTLESMNNLGFALSRMGDHKKAEDMLRNAVDTRIKVLGAAHPSTLSSLNNLALLFEKLDKLDEAEVLYKDLMETRARVLGGKHPNTLITMNNLALLYEKQGKFKDAESLHRKVLKLRTESLGPSHNQTLTSMLNLARLVKNLDMYQEAETLNRKALKAYESYLGELHPETLVVKNNLACLLKSKQENLPEAEKLLLQVAEARKKLFGDNHPDTLTALSNLAEVYVYQKRFSEAEPLRKLVLKRRKEIYGESHSRTLKALAGLAFLYRCQGRYDLAEPLFKQALEAAVKKYPKGGTELEYRRLDYSNCLVEMKLYHQAEKGLIKSYAGFESALGIKHSLTQRAVRLLVEVYDKTQQEEKAKKYKALISKLKD